MFTTYNSTMVGAILNMDHSSNPTVVVKSNLIILQVIIHWWAGVLRPLLLGQCWGTQSNTGVKGVALASFMLKLILVVRTTKINFNNPQLVTLHLVSDNTKDAPGYFKRYFLMDYDLSPQCLLSWSLTLCTQFGRWLPHHQQWRACALP